MKIKPIFLFTLLLFASSLCNAQLPFRTEPQETSAIQFQKQIIKKRNLITPLLVPKGFIILDPGHGGTDTGTQSVSKPRYQEKSLNLVTAKFVRNYLTQLGYKVEMTRETDRFVTLDKRARIANEKKPDLFVSIHYNSAPSLEAKGVEVFYYHDKKQKERSNASKKLAQIVLKQVLKQTKAASRGVKHGNFAVIRETKMPAILIEGGFVSNEKELENLKNPDYLKKISWGIAKGIDQYLKN